MLSSSLLNEIDRVKVHYDGTWVGTLAMAKNGCLAFEYSSSWLAKGFSISPLSLPLEKRVLLPILNHCRVYLEFLTTVFPMAGAAYW